MSFRMQFEKWGHGLLVPFASSAKNHSPTPWLASRNNPFLIFQTACEMTSRQCVVGIDDSAKKNCILLSATSTVHETGVEPFLLISKFVFVLLYVDKPQNIIEKSLSLTLPNCFVWMLWIENLEIDEFYGNNILKTGQDFFAKCQNFKCFDVFNVSMSRKVSRK